MFQPSKLIFGTAGIPLSTKPRNTLEGITLGRRALDNMHIQVSGVTYSEKGERNHLNLEESDLKWKDLLTVWKEFKLKGVVIAESPSIEGDSLLLQKYWRGK